MQKCGQEQEKGFQAYSVDKGLYSGTGPSDPLAAGISVRKMERLCASGARKSMEFFFDHVGKWNTV